MAQFARPIGDLDNTGSWTPDVEATLWEELNDGASPDGNNVVSDTTPVVTEPFTVDLGTITDPVSSTGHILRIRWAKNSGGGGSKTIRIELREGYVNESTLGSLRATDDYSINSTTLTTDATALSGAEADSISDYSDLQIRVMGVASNRALKVDFVELETPDAGAIIDGAGIGHGVGRGLPVGDLIVNSDGRGNAASSNLSVGTRVQPFTGAGRAAPSSLVAQDVVVVASAEGHAVSSGLSVPLGALVVATADGHVVGYATSVGNVPVIITADGIAHAVPSGLAVGSVSTGEFIGWGIPAAIS